LGNEWVSNEIDATISAKQNDLFSSIFFSKSLELKDEEKSRQGKLHVCPVPSQGLPNVASTCLCFSFHVYPCPLHLRDIDVPSVPWMRWALMSPAWKIISSLST